MGTLSFWHLAIVAIIAALTVVPLWRICGRAGFSPMWSVLGVVPLGAIVVLWMLALRRWRRAANG
jgi:RsiW-degrading membrane proteinase PrsW (M82 family)